MTEQKSCQTCGKPIVRKRYENGKLEPPKQFARRAFCDTSCAAQSSENSVVMARRDSREHNGRTESGLVECLKCRIVKDKTWFSCSRRGKQPQYSYCKECVAAKSRELRLRKFFLLTVEEADRVLDYQENLCAICGDDTRKKGKRLALDHRHSDGLLRGGLCTWCNRAIARFNDDVNLLQKAAEYLENPPAIRALGRQHFTRPGRIGTKKQRAAVKREAKLLKKQKKAQTELENIFS